MQKGSIKKMRTRLDDVVQYELVLDETILMNDLIGEQISLKWNGIINCQKCNKVTKKSFGEGFCYSCFSSAPEAAECILRPELCKAHLGEGRDPESGRIAATRAIAGADLKHRGLSAGAGPMQQPRQDGGDDRCTCCAKWRCLHTKQGEWLRVL